MEATFNTSATAACANCEYRQFIKGYFKGTKNDGTVEKFDKLLAPGVLLSETVFQEDGGNLGGNWTRYGHREDQSGIWTNVIDTYTPAPRATGCTYNGGDMPGICLPSTTWKGYNMHLSFEGRIVQMPAETVVSTKSWDVFCSSSI
jgi:hypothetical protein